jgi:hypothetical protein
MQLRDHQVIVIQSDTKAVLSLKKIWRDCSSNLYMWVTQSLLLPNLPPWEAIWPLLIHSPAWTESLKNKVPYFIESLYFKRGG